MPRYPEYRELEPMERKAALMRAAGASLVTIALELRSNHASVANILQRPRVAAYLLRLEATAVDGIEDTVEIINDKIKTTAARAFEVENQVMEDLVELGEVYDEPHSKIRAKLGAVATAQDILDRAGNRAPTKVVNAHMHATIPPQVLEHLVDVLHETKQIEARGEEGGGEALGTEVQTCNGLAKEVQEVEEDRRCSVAPHEDREPHNVREDRNNGNAR